MQRPEAKNRQFLPFLQARVLKLGIFGLVVFVSWFEWVLVENMIFVVVVLLQYVCLVKLKHNKKGKNMVKKIAFSGVFFFFFLTLRLCLSSKTMTRPVPNDKLMSDIFVGVSSISYKLHRSSQ